MPHIQKFEMSIGLLHVWATLIIIRQRFIFWLHIMPIYSKKHNTLFWQVAITTLHVSPFLERNDRAWWISWLSIPWCVINWDTLWTFINYYADLLLNAHWPGTIQEAFVANYKYWFPYLWPTAVVIFSDTHYREAPCQIFRTECSIQLDNQKLAGFDQFTGTENTHATDSCTIYGEIAIIKLSNLYIYNLTISMRLMTSQWNGEFVAWTSYYTYELRDTVRTSFFDEKRQKMVHRKLRKKSCSSHNSGSLIFSMLVSVKIPSHCPMFLLLMG